ncbi:MAG TPA: hypothetical protein VGI64_09095 [Streptosporangiaceae bacterium]
MGPIIAIGVVLILVWRFGSRKLVLTAAALFSIWWLATVGALWLVIVIAFGLVIVSWISVRLHPRVACPNCGGTGRFRGSIFNWRFRFCANCSGTGRNMSPLVRYLGTDRTREMLRAQQEANRSAPGKWAGGP